MLKWTVVHRGGSGGGGVGRCVSPCCPPLPRAPFKINISSGTNRQRRSTNRKKIESQENRGCEAVSSPKNRDVGLLTCGALRDVSNTRCHEQTPPRTPGVAENNRTRKQSVTSTPTKTLKRPRSPRKVDRSIIGREELRSEDGFHGSPERKKQPCAEVGKHKFMMLDKGNQTLPPNPPQSACKYVLDSSRSLFQIEYTPRPLHLASALEDSPDRENHSVLFMNQSPSPVELDHKEIPLRPEEKEIILATPICARGAALREEFSRILTKRRPAREITNETTGVSPLALRLAHLRVEARDGEVEAPKPTTPPQHNMIFAQQLSSTTTKSIPMPFCRGGAVDPEFLANHILLEKWAHRNRGPRPRASLVGGTVLRGNDTAQPRDCPMTNHDRNKPDVSRTESSAARQCSTAMDTSRKRRGVVFNENYFSLNTPPNSESEERQSSSFANSIDLDAPSTLKRQRVVRRRRPREPEEEHRPNKIPRRPHPISCLTLPDGIPSPFDGVPPSTKKEDCERIGPFVGLTLPEGIPSPPSPPGGVPCQGDEEDLTGVGPLLPSPVAHARPPPAAPASPVGSEDTWDSHQMHFLKTPKLTAGHILHGQQPLLETSVVDSASSSKINDDDDDEGASSIASSSVTACSPQAVFEGVSRSRRCLTFASPKTAVTPSRPKKTPWKQPGELELVIYFNCGLLTVHIMRGKNLQTANGNTNCNAYVKVSLVPSGNERTFHRTCVRKDSKNPKFDDRFSFELTEEDLQRRILVSAWHRDRGNRKSEFLGCMSFAVKHAIKKEISGSFRLLSQSSGRVKNLPSMTNTEQPGHQQIDTMANQSESSMEELVSVEDSEIAPTPEQGKDRRKSCSKKDTDKGVVDDHIFLRHLELDPEDESAPPQGRTPFTTTRILKRNPGSSYGFSIAWTHPPRIERVESGLPADQAGLRPGDYVIFVEKTNVVTLQEEEILKLIKACGNQIVLEVYRKANSNGVYNRGLGPATQQPRSSTACSATTTATTSIELSKRRLHLPQVTFNSEVGSGIIV